ncbi:unnamed protein product [Boreogadus saida]
MIDNRVMYRRGGEKEKTERRLAMLLATFNWHRAPHRKDRLLSAYEDEASLEGKPWRRRQLRQPGRQDSDPGSDIGSIRAIRGNPE